MSSVTTRIEALGKDNFDTWKLQVEALLIKNDTWGFVSGEKVKPEVIAGNAQSENALKEWKDGDRKAKSDLILAISPSELKQIKNCQTSNEVWKKLHEIYQSKGPARKATLLKKLILHKMSESSNIKAHIGDFFDAVDKLLDMGISINDDLLAIMLLYSLPESFDNFRCAIESRDELPSPESLKVKILEEYEARIANETEGHQNAMLVRKVQQGRPEESDKGVQRKPFSKYPQKYFKFKCHRCRKVGHKASECKQQRQSAEKSESSKVCVEANQSHIKTEFALKQSENRDEGKATDWCLDSGCTSHMTSRMHDFSTIRKVEKSLNLANGESTKIQGIGDIKLLTSNEQGTRNLKLENAMFVPDLKTNLMSVAKITDKGYQVNFTKNAASVIAPDGQEILTADREGDLYYIRRSEDDNVVNFTAVKSSGCLDDWHRKLSHINTDYIRDMYNREKVLGLNIKGTFSNLTCETCIKAKQAELPYPKHEGARASELLEIIHSDICGPMKTTSIGGAKYFITFIDDKSRWCQVYFLKQKSDAFNAFKEFKALAETHTGKKIKCLQSDNGAEFCNQRFDEFLKAHGIKRRLTVPYSPQQNGTAERKNRTLVEAARCLMIEAGTPAMFWAEAINTANYVRNRCPTKALLGETPYKIWNGTKPNVSYFQIFGSKVFALLKGKSRRKFEEKSLECVFVGYSDESKAYRLWSPALRKIIISRDVKFLQELNFKTGYEDCFTDEKCSEQKNKVRHTEARKESQEEKVENLEVVLHDGEGKNENKCDISEGAAGARKRGRPRLIRTGKKGRPRKVYHRRSFTHPKLSNCSQRRGDIMCDPTQEPPGSCSSELEYESANLACVSDPLTMDEALSGINAKEWKCAIEYEYLAHLRNQTWDIVHRPEDKNIIGNKFVFTTKYTASGNIERRKARLVAKGFAQLEGADYHETFAPVVRASSIRIIMAMAVENGWEVHQMDVVSAYLNGEISETVYMEIPEYIEYILRELEQKTRHDKEAYGTLQEWISMLEDDSKPKACLLKKALYGLRQSGREWYNKLDHELTKLNFTRNEVDPCVYTIKRKRDILLLAIYVDDLIIASGNVKWISEIKQKLATLFEMKDLGRIHYCLGLEFKQSDDRQTISISQARYAQRVLHRFQMTNCKPQGTPLDANIKLKRPTENDATNFKAPYQNLIGSLMYLAVSTRPDLSYAVSMLSQFNSSFSVEHWTSAKRVLRYLRKTYNQGLVYRKCNSDLVGYADADWGTSIDDRKSYTGYAFIIAGAAVSWESRKQRTVALSSTEAEYVALAEATKEAVYLQRFISTLGHPKSTTTIYNDNQGAQSLARNPAFHNRTKHIDIRFHFIREMYQKGCIDLKYMPSSDMPADVLTKSLGKQKHLRCIESLGMEVILDQADENFEKGCCK